LADKPDCGLDYGWQTLPLHTLLEQSAPDAQVWPAAQVCPSIVAHGPPQSTSVSPPFV
jgi:hypothetical protein